MSEQLPAPAASNSFERIKRVNESGAEFWATRELARVLEYTDFRKFIAVLGVGTKFFQDSRCSFSSCATLCYRNRSC